jgi:hypothetical protein
MRKFSAIERHLSTIEVSFVERRGVAGEDGVVEGYGTSGKSDVLEVPSIKHHAGEVEIVVTPVCGLSRVQEMGSDHANLDLS